MGRMKELYTSLQEAGCNKEQIKYINDCLFKTYPNKDLEYEERDELERNLGCETNEMLNLNK